MGHSEIKLLRNGDQLTLYLAGAFESKGCWAAVVEGRTDRFDGILKTFVGSKMPSASDKDIEVCLVDLNSLAGPCLLYVQAGGNKPHPTQPPKQYRAWLLWTGSTLFRLPHARADEAANGIKRGAPAHTVARNLMGLPDLKKCAMPVLDRSFAIA